jgi:hypothetical protein
MPIAILFIAVFISILIAGANTPTQSQGSRPTPIPEAHFFRDVQTDCEYIRTDSTSRSSYTPRMEGAGLDYRHRGCRQ